MDRWNKWLKVKVSQSCLTLWDPMDYTVHGILQARILEWVAFPFFRRSSQPRDRTQVSHIAGRFFTNWATREAWQKTLKSEYSAKPCFDPKELWDNIYVLCYTTKYVNFYASVYTQCSEERKPGVEPGLWKWRSAMAYRMCWVWDVC